MPRSFTLLVPLLTGACTTDFDLPETSNEPPSVLVEPFGELDGAPPVLRLHVERAAGASALADFRLFSGALSDYHLRRIRSRDLPATLLEREIGVLAWRDGSDVRVAPLGILEPGTYSLATPELGRVAELLVEPAALPVLARFWPPAEVGEGAGLAVFCGEGAPVGEDGGLELAPAGIPARAAAGIDALERFSEACVHVIPETEPPPGVPMLPPPSLNDALVEPSLLVASSRSVAGSVCREAEIAMGPGCALVDDDRVALRVGDAPVLYALDTPRPLLGVARPGKSLVLRGFQPSSTTRVTGVALDASGRYFPIDLDVETAAARPHLVLNEVLADPKGSEATSEWIEIVNDGARAESLEGWQLDDAVEPVALPALALAPGELALIVAESYAPEPELDVVPPDGVTLLVVPRLGRSGLTNAGELLRLVDPAGVVVSRWPARAAPGPGRSLARSRPDAPDGEASSFAPHAAPGASPGLPNVVDE